MTPSFGCTATTKRERSRLSDGSSERSWFSRTSPNRCHSSSAESADLGVTECSTVEVKSTLWWIRSRLYPSLTSPMRSAVQKLRGLAVAIANSEVSDAEMAHRGSLSFVRAECLWLFDRLGHRRSTASPALAKDG